MSSEVTDPSNQFTYPNMLWNNLSFGDNFTADANKDFVIILSLNIIYSPLANLEIGEILLTLITL